MTNGKHKFVFSEVFNNADGKTSGSGFIGVYLGIIGGLAFIAAMVGYFLGIENTVEVMKQTTFLIGAVTVLLGARKITTFNKPSSFDAKKTNEEERG